VYRRPESLQHVGVTVRVERWGEHGPRPPPGHGLDPLFAAMTVAVEAVIPCPVAQAWALVCDVERIGEFSPECVAAWWLPGYPARAVGGRFEGRPHELTSGPAAETGHGSGMPAVSGAAI
jgi:hypothetical protein